MCGRFHVGEELIRKLESRFPELNGMMKKGDVYPSQKATVLFGEKNRKDLTLNARSMYWGYEPVFYSRLLINARAETVRTRSAFREDYRKRRCVIPAESFYEWKRSESDKVKYEFSDPGRTLWLAGIFRWEGETGRFVVLTTAANRSMMPIHDRMPVLMEAHEVKEWLQNPESSEAILERPPKELNVALAQDAWEQLSLFDL